jgi:hypothetical protein
VYLTASALPVDTGCFKFSLEVTFEVLTAVNIQADVFWFVMPCNVLLIPTFQRSMLPPSHIRITYIHVMVFWAMTPRSVAVLPTFQRSVPPPPDTTIAYIHVMVFWDMTSCSVVIMPTSRRCLITTLHGVTTPEEPDINSEVFIRITTWSLKFYELIALVLFVVW